jgi:hypothetical protein
MKVKKDLTGWKQPSGFLTVINDDGGDTVLCRCVCGNEKWLSRANVRNEHTKSCGCLKSKNSPRTILCAMCGKPFHPTSSRSLYCPDCRKKVIYHNHKAAVDVNGTIKTKDSVRYKVKLINTDNPLTGIRPSGKKYMVNFMIGDRPIYLGLYGTITEAQKIVKEYYRLKLDYYDDGLILKHNNAKDITGKRHKYIVPIVPISISDNDNVTWLCFCLNCRKFFSIAERDIFSQESCDECKGALQ